MRMSFGGRCWCVRARARRLGVSAWMRGCKGGRHIAGAEPRTNVLARFLVGWLVACLGLSPAVLSAEEHRSEPAARRASTPSASVAGWTAVGAGAGFGLGLYVGLRAFDDAVNSERKVWTTAVLVGAAGAVAGYLVGRARQTERMPGPAAAGPVRRTIGTAAERDSADVAAERASPVPAEEVLVRFELRRVGLREIAHRAASR